MFGCARGSWGAWGSVLTVVWLQGQESEEDHLMDLISGKAEGDAKSAKAAKTAAKTAAKAGDKPEAKK